MALETGDSVAISEMDMDHAIQLTVPTSASDHQGPAFDPERWLLPADVPEVAAAVRLEPVACNGC
jgi:hypothetical protein